MKTFIHLILVSAAILVSFGAFADFREEKPPFPGGGHKPTIHYICTYVDQHHSLYTGRGYSETLAKYDAEAVCHAESPIPETCRLRDCEKEKWP